jgi:predicted RNA-binding protein with PIN domain
MKEYIIDGNNLLHKMKEFSSLQKKDKQLAREKLALKLDRYFALKSVKVYIYFDGYRNIPVRTNKVKLVYSDNITADEKIRQHIERSQNPRNIILVSSDDEIKRIAHVCSAEIINSEEFAKMLLRKNTDDEEEKRIKGLDDDEFKKLFGVD